MMQKRWSQVDKMTFQQNCRPGPRSSPESTVDVDVDVDCYQRNRLKPMGNYHPLGLYIYVCVCVCAYTYIYLQYIKHNLYIYIYI